MRPEHNIKTKNGAFNGVKDVQTFKTYNEMQLKYLSINPTWFWVGLVWADSVSSYLQ